LNDGTFDNRGLSVRRTVASVIGVVVLMIVVLPIVAATGPIGGAILVLIMVPTILWYRRRRRTRLLLRMPTTEIAKLSGGYVEIFGTAGSADGRELRDPIENRSCVWFGIETLRHEEGSPSMWLPIRRAASRRPFVLRDSGGGSCLVDPRGAQLALAGASEVVVSERVRHRVWRIVAGDVLTVVGEAKREHDGWRVGRPGGRQKYLITHDSPDGKGSAPS
jgi:hypothetical protein